MDSTIITPSPPISPTLAPGGRRAIITPAVVILLLSLILVASSLVIAVTGMNKTALETSRSLATATLVREAKRLAELAIDYAFWDIAAQNLSVKPDTAWADQNIGAYMHGTFGITFSAVLDTAGRTVMAFHNGRLTQSDAQSVLGDAVVKHILSRNRSDAGNPPALQSGLTKATDGINIVGFAPFTPETKSSNEAGILARPILILARQLDSSTVNELGAAVTLEEFRLNTVRGGSGAQIAVQGLLGADVGYAAWQQAYPGDALLQHLIPAALGAIIAIAVLMRIIVREADRIVEERYALAGELSAERALNDIRSRFVAMISHEIRTPLSTIQSAADLMTRYWQRMPDAERSGEILAIQTSLANIKGIIDDVLSLDKIGASKPRKELIDLAEICREQWREIIAAARTSHQLEMRVADVPALVNADVILLRAVLRNLLINAVKYSPEGSVIRVTLESEKLYLTLRVEDQGYGIPESDAGRIFEPFFRAANVEHVQGIGIGLAIVKSALNQMGGSVKLAKGNLAGACFEIKLPRD